MTLEFAKNRATLGSRSRARLDDVAEQLLAERTLVVEVHGHADQRGDDSVNDRLSRRRADRVADYLRDRGVAGHRIVVDSFGERRPLDDGTSDEALRRNRRVEITYRRSTP